MKTIQTKSIQFFGWCFLLSSMLFQTMLQAGTPILSEVEIKQPPRWEKLGNRKINHALDRDEILVTAAQGTFKALKIRVDQADINLHKVTVHYRNGRSQTLNLRQTVRDGGESRVLNLSGRKRIIKKVVFWYDTKSYERRRGKVELWGRT